MQNRAAEHGKGGFAPMVFKPLARGVNQHGGHVLHVRYRQQRSKADFFQRIEMGGRAGGVGRVKTQDNLIL